MKRCVLRGGDRVRVGQLDRTRQRDGVSQAIVMGRIGARVSIRLAQGDVAGLVDGRPIPRRSESRQQIARGAGLRRRVAHAPLELGVTAAAKFLELVFAAKRRFPMLAGHVHPLSHFAARRLRRAFPIERPRRRRRPHNAAPDLACRLPRNPPGALSSPDSGASLPGVWPRQ